jgi:hypothetical protein
MSFADAARIRVSYLEALKPKCQPPTNAKNDIRPTLEQEKKDESNQVNNWCL